MKKIGFGLLSWLLPLFVFAQDSSVSFAPPPSDYSVIFLGNIFGIVDGVLHGTGSQIMGSMFGVFNSAVLALGGIIIMYTLLVSTMNTAHEGQMLGQKWSSIWVPLRSTLGIALLIPKASGYCLMQIFVMWVVVQGVGAADKIWDAALNYLNRGGVIVQTQMDPVKSLTSDTSHVADGASTILAGQVCMLGLQNVLENQRQGYLSSKQNKSGPCAGTPSGVMQTFCTTAVPNFINTVNTVAVQNKGEFQVNMPNFDANSPYASLNGVCGVIKWSPFNQEDIDKIQTNLSSTTTDSIMQTVKMSRAIAIQQMYLDLTNVAQVVVNNDPALNPNNNNDNNQKEFSSIAVQQFGVPYLANGSPCQTPDKDCVTWGSDPSSASAPLFSGGEFQGAVADYNGIMLPTLNLVTQAKKKQSSQDARNFIEQAKTQGWLLAGSYFFDLARLNSADISSANQTDQDTGLNGATFNTNVALSAFGDNNQCQGKYANLCEWLNKDSRNVKQVMGLIDGSTVLQSPLGKPNLNPTDHKAETGVGSSTVYGFINNSVMVNLPGQPGLKPPKFALKFNIKIQPGMLYLKSQNFDCGKVKIMFFHFCLGRMMGNLFYNTIIRNVFNFFLDLMQQVINLVIMTFLSLPLLGMAEIFKQGVSVIQQPSVNPVIALANMGVNYINFANELWILLLEISVMTSLIPIFGVFIFALIALVFPLLLAWMGIMLSIGFITAYYIPFLPYMIFTFGSIAWLMSVIEAMVAAPIVALGVTNPEGHEAFGKGEPAIMIMMNVFLRPAMMIIGYIGAIALSYVAVWIINAGFANAVLFIQGDPNGPTWNYSSDYSTDYSTSGNLVDTGNSDPFSVDMKDNNTIQDRAGQISSVGYTGWAGIYGFFFSILFYTTMYLIAVQKAFTLITILPDKVLRWIGGQQENIGQEASQWGEEAKKQVGDAGGSTSKAAQQMDQQLSGYAEKGISKLKSMGGSGPSVGATGTNIGTDATPPNNQS